MLFLLAIAGIGAGVVLYYVMYSPAARQEDYFDGNNFKDADEDYDDEEETDEEDVVVPGETVGNDRAGEVGTKHGE